MKQLLAFFTVVIIAFSVWAIFRQQDPVTTAKLKCEAAIEYVSNYDVSIADVSRALVSGDVFNGVVTMPFEINGIRHRGICVFESGSTKSITLDGKMLAGSSK